MQAQLHRDCFHNEKVLLKLYCLGVICFQTCVLNFSIWLPTEKFQFKSNYHAVVPKIPIVIAGSNYMVLMLFLLRGF